MDDASDTVYKFCTLDPDKGHIILNEKLTMGTPSEVLTIEATDGYSGSNGAAQTASVTGKICLHLDVLPEPTFRQLSLRQGITNLESFCFLCGHNYGERLLV